MPARHPVASAARRAPDGPQLRFTIFTGNSLYPPVLDLLIPAWRQFGVELTPASVDLPTLFGRTNPSSIPSSTPSQHPPSVARREKLVAEMQQIIAADLPALTLCYPTQTPGGFATGLPGSLTLGACAC